MARAASLFAAQRYAEAAGCYRAVLSIDPNDHRAYLGLADCSMGRGQRDDAVEELVGAAADFREREDYDGAFALMARAMTLDPERLELHIDVAELEAASGRIEMAVGRLENLARAYEQSSQYEEAAAIHEVIEAWTAEEEPGATPPEVAPPAEAVPVHVVAGHTQPAIVAEPPPLPPTRPPEQLLVRAALPGTPKPATAARTESVLLRKTPPPPPPPRAVRTKTEIPTAGPSKPPVRARPRRRGPKRDGTAPRWQPSTVQGKAMPELPTRKSKGPPPQPAAKARIEPAPSPRRGAVKLDKLPALTGPVPERKRSAAVPRRMKPQSTALLHPNLPEENRKRAEQAPGPVTLGKLTKVQFKKAKKPAAVEHAPAPQPRPQPPKSSSLAERLRRASAGPQSPIAVEIEEEPTRLWAPDGLLL